MPTGFRPSINRTGRFAGKTPPETAQRAYELRKSGQPAETVEKALAARDEWGVRIATAQLELLERCAAGDIASGWARYEAVRRDFYTDVLESRVSSLREAFDDVVEHDKSRAARIGEQLIAKTVELGMLPMEAEASFHTANAYYERTDGDRCANLERSCVLQERALEIFERDLDAVDKDMHVGVLLNLGAAVAARHRGDPAANQERAISLQRRVLELASKEEDGRSWAMAHTNLGLNLLEREHVVEGGEEDEEEAQQRMQATLSEAIEHFEKALTWRSFERDPGDWAYTQINLALAYSRRGGGDGRADLRKAIDHGDEAIRGFRAGGQASHRAQALGNRATAQSNLALLPETDPAAREALLGAAEHDARMAIAAVGEEAHGVEAGRRWWQLGLVLSAREQYTPDLIATVRRALQELTPENAPRDCREAGRRLAVLAVEAGDWAVAAEMWEQAARGAAAATESRATRGGRFAEIAKNGNVFRWAAYALIRAGVPGRAVEMLELGRARELSSWLQRDVVDLRPLREADEQLCGRFVDLRHRIEAAERAGATITDPAVARAVEGLDATVAEIRRLPGLAGFLVRPQLGELAGALPADETIAYPVTSPDGSAWLLVCAGSDGKPQIAVVDLPSLTSTAVFEALARIDREAGTVEGYLVEQPITGKRLNDEIATVSSLLGPTLLQPLARALHDADRSSVCIVAIGLLGRVPLHALTWEQDGAARCLLDEVEVAYTPSAYVRHVCRERAGARRAFARLVVVGNPLPHTKPLPHSEHEAALVDATVPASERVLLLREAATKEAIMHALPFASHVHLACHGRAAGDARAFDSALSFAHNQTVSAAEILALDLSRARLVVRLGL